MLTDVEQSPSTSMEEALLPTMSALISNELLRHSDMDVKVSVVSCISQITRISAPDAPYNDDLMKVHLTNQGRYKDCKLMFCMKTVSGMLKFH